MSAQSVSGHGMPGTASRSKRGWLVIGAGAALIALAIVLLAYLVIRMGSFNVAADTPHSESVFWFLKTVRDQSIAVRAKNIVVPSDLTDPERISRGAGQYAEMCASCHLGPGMKRTEVSRGLYPRSTELRRGTGYTPAEDFWVVKHGITATGMPAWGVTHNDETLWDTVAFLRKLPELTPDQYQALVKSAPKTHEEMEMPKQ